MPLLSSQVCLASSSPSTFHFVLVNSLHRIITNVSLRGGGGAGGCGLRPGPSTGSPELAPFLISLLSFQSHLDWWPKIDALYCYSGELRFMFSDTLNRVIQGAGTHAPLRPTTVRASAPAGM